MFLVPVFNHNAPRDISVFGRILPIARPLPQASDGFIDGKRLHLQINSQGNPEWIAAQYFFKVDEEVKLGQGSFRTCYKAYGKDPSGKIVDMVAKKHNVKPRDVDVHRESGGVYAAVASVIEKFKQEALEIEEVKLWSAVYKAIKDIRVSHSRKISLMTSS